MKFYQGTSFNRWERLRNYPRPHAVPSLLDHWTARTKKWPFKLKLTAWNKCDGAERTQVTLWFLFTYQSVLFHTYIFFSFALLEMYFLRQWLRAKLGYQTKLCDSFGKWIQKSKSPVQSNFLSGYMQWMSNSIGFTFVVPLVNDAWTKQKKRKKMVESKVNYEFNFEIRRNTRGIINGNNGWTDLRGFLPCTHCWLTRLDLKLPRWDITRMSLN